MVVFIKFSSVCTVLFPLKEKKNSEKAMRKFDSGPAAPRKPVAPKCQSKLLVAARVAADRSGSVPLITRLDRKIENDGSDIVIYIVGF
jgi:hypothetical protein